MHISDSPEGASDDAQELPASANHSNSRTCVRTLTCLAEGAKVNEGRHDYGLIYFTAHDDAQGANTGHCFPTPATVSTTLSVTTCKALAS
jgi:hypothetical protein